jgi:hypothetical protein
VILSSCDTAQGRQLWLIPLTGDSLHPLTALNSGSDALANPYTAWSFGAVVIGLDAPPCGSASQFITIAANGLFDYTRVSAPPGLSASIIPSGATSDAVFGRAVNGCSEARAEALVRFSPATNGLTVLFGANVGGGSVQSARTIGVDS